eukprot:TRINITY_DN7892_c0_g1_i1.p1 TRINITY_DN7892_c0_g1~~TRINITY_DN7892_c0_g1_i1.p1  ORF type:complete len:115 (-),score=10.58 TRINITY_DN7892_c0_g1_i1:164-508(-)
MTYESELYWMLAGTALSNSAGLHRCCVGGAKRANTFTTICGCCSNVPSHMRASDPCRGLEMDCQGLQLWFLVSPSGFPGGTSPLSAHPVAESGACLWVQCYQQEATCRRDASWH